MLIRTLKVLVLLVFLTSCNSKENNLTNLTIQTENGSLNYRVESAVTDEQRQKGLMHRSKLDADSGMIFAIPSQQNSMVAMWMKNTLIPLDMLFTDQHGKIVWIHENAEPLSTKIIRPETTAPVFFVIELNGGDVKKHHIKIGDTVKHQSIH